MYLRQHRLGAPVYPVGLIPRLPRLARIVRRWQADEDQITDLGWDFVVVSNPHHFSEATPRITDPMLRRTGLSPVSGKNGIAARMSSRSGTRLRPDTR
jgi:hypothetical protein